MKIKYRTEATLSLTKAFNQSVDRLIDFARRTVTSDKVIEVAMQAEEKGSLMTEL